ncbi:MAG: hypothetical protein O7A71_11975 [Chloroflexi bacterium]|nr:hypothetical protein [Chloroflexota bacterium]
MRDDRTHLFQRNSVALEDLAEAAPARPLPRWLILLAVFFAGLATMGIVISQVASVGSDAESAITEAELAAAYDRGFQAGEESGAQVAAAESDRAAAASYRRGFVTGRQTATDITVNAFTISPFLAYAVPLSRLDLEYLASCPAEIPQWFFALGGIEECGS